MQGMKGWVVATSALGGRIRSAERPPDTRRPSHNALAPNDRAAEHLATAWRELYGREPSASSAYSRGGSGSRGARRSGHLTEKGKPTPGTVVAVLRGAPRKVRTVFLGSARPEGQARRSPSCGSPGTRRMTVVAIPTRRSHSTSPTRKRAAAVRLAITLVTWWRHGTIAGPGSAD